MRPPDEIKLEFTRQWARRAENDYRTASHLLKSGGEYAYGATFHAQQTAEKYLKAFLVWHQIDFRKTHDIAMLIELATPVVPDISEILADASELTPYGVEYRYPGDYPAVTGVDAVKAVRLATLVRDEIRKRLPTDSME